ncbi:MAG TPA: phage holin family protein [Bacteroidales bacterium]|nr:phage holin family protein [Bacteroidales bacterium]
MEKNALSENLAEITAAIKSYVNTRFDLLKLTLLQKITRAGTYMLTFVSVLVSLFSILIFLMFAFSFWYGERTGSLSEGFLISAGIFLLLLIILFLLRRVIFSNTLIRIFSHILFSDEDDKPLR